MEIIKRAQSGPHKFKVIKPILWAGSVCGVGGEVEVSNSVEALGLVQSGKIVPADIPATGEYVALRDIKLAGKVKAFKCKQMEKVILRDEQALRLMLEGAIIPVDDGQWRPHNRKLEK